MWQCVCLCVGARTVKLTTHNNVIIIILPEMGDHDVPHLTVLSVEDQECIHVRMTGPGPQSFINIYIIIQDSTSSVKTKGGVGAVPSIHMASIQRRHPIKQ